MSALTAIMDAMGVALNAVMDDEDSIQVVPRLNFSPQSPTSVDIYPGDPFRGQETAGFGELDGEYVFTVRARVNTPDEDGAQDMLLNMMDDEHAFCVAAALEANNDLGGLISQVVVDGNTGFRIFDDPPGAMLGCSWRVRVVNLTS